jgi:hypothetical protein
VRIILARKAEGMMPLHRFKVSGNINLCWINKFGEVDWIELARIEFELPARVNMLIFLRIS